MAGENGSRDQNQQKRRKKDAYGRSQCTPKTRHQGANEGSGDHYRPRTDHADGHGDQKIMLIEPAILLNYALLQEGNNDETAAKGQSACFEEEQKQFTYGRRGGSGRCGSAGDQGGCDRQACWRGRASG